MVTGVRHLCGALGLAVAALVITSCTTGSGSPETEPSLGQIPVVRDVASATALVLPLDPYQYSQQEYITVRRAAWRLTRDCLRRFGVEYTLPEDAVLADLPPLDQRNGRRYGLLDPASAAERGYNSADPARPKRNDGWNPSDTEKLLVRGAVAGTSAVPKDVTGKALPDGGCSGEADRTLQNGVSNPANTDLAEQLSREANHRSENDSRVRAAVSAWVSCMKRSGYAYQSVWEPNDRSWPEPPGDQEIATAKTDVACKQETNLAGIWYSVEAAYQKRQLDRQAQKLTAIRDAVRGTARNATRVIEGG